MRFVTYRNDTWAVLIEHNGKPFGEFKLENIYTGDIVNLMIDAMVNECKDIMINSGKNLQMLKDNWVDEPWYHEQIKDTFTYHVNGFTELQEHRDFVEKNGFGFGERAFWWAWKIILDEIVADIPKLLEVGVYRGATLSLWRILKPVAEIYGITPLNTTGDYPDFDYRRDIALIHDTFNQERPKIIEALSSDTFALNSAKTISPFDLIYLDGGHEYLTVVADLVNYSPMIKPGGFLVMDDAAHYTHQNWGEFQGHKAVSDALVDFMGENGDKWEFLFSVVHIMVYRRK